MREYLNLNLLTKPKTFKAPSILEKYLTSDPHWNELSVIGEGLKINTYPENFVRSYLQFMLLNNISESDDELENPFKYRGHEENPITEADEIIDNLIKSLNQTLESFSFYKNKKEFIQAFGNDWYFQPCGKANLDEEEYYYLDLLYYTIKKALKGNIGTPKNEYYVFRILINTAIMASFIAYLKKHEA